MVIEFSKMKNYIKDFSKQRNWDKLHSPKNISMDIVVEATELMDIFTWLDIEQSKNVKNNFEIFEHIKEEMADVLFALIRLADLLDVDLNQAFWDKVKKNEKKYPVEKAKLIAEKIQSIGK
ncbi:MAG: nucleotide pyrophosphohydrolase [Parachlamydiales bacterium]|nr:nucleotide pyrophosphohydrolase [Parachlamydiales bacterium]